MRITLAQLNFHIGNFEDNYAQISQTIKAIEDHSDLIVFPELAVCGYPPKDLLFSSHFIREVHVQLEKIARLCTKTAVIVGAPSASKAPYQRKLHNSAYFLFQGEVKYVAHKSLLPDYDVFDENRYFIPGTNHSCVAYKGKKIALTICEDLWNTSENQLYDHFPLDKLMSENPDMVINIAASPFSKEQAEERNTVLTYHARKHSTPIIYVNQVGAQTDLLFDGSSRVIDSKGQTRLQLPTFEEKTHTFHLDELPATKDTELKSSPISIIKKGLVLGIQDYFKKTGLKQATLGLSGGIDSAVVFALLVEALGSENVMPVLLPSKFTSDASNLEAIQMANNLGTAYKTIPIESIYGSLEKELAPHFEGKKEDITEENLQSRSRAILLMALANKLGYILINTSNKSEIAVGYGTLYGDLCGGISVIGDLYKTEVYALAREINREKEIIPNFIIDRPPSAELRNDQKDSDSLPPYELLDELLKLHVEQGIHSSDLIKKGYDPKIVTKIVQLVSRSEWKRHQTAPILRISSKSFGTGRRIPIVSKMD